jgi:protein gp37
MIELALELIVRDPQLQVRRSISQDLIEQYAERMRDGIAFQPVVVYHDGSHYWLSRGFHRCLAAERAGWETVAAEVREGSRSDARIDAAVSTSEWDDVGLKHPIADKKQAVVMILEEQEEWDEPWGDQLIADRVGVSFMTVRRARAKWEEERSNFNNVKGGTQANGAKPKVGKDGKKYSRRSKSPPKEIKAEIKPDPMSKFNGTNEMVDWARWTWNPVTGCEHNCVYCYARDIANRFYPEKFEPTFHENRLEAPRRTPHQDLEATAETLVERTSWRNVFVCSMADLFGRWVPDEWIEKVFDSCRQSPEWNYLFLTKFPQRYVGLDFPETAWVGTSVDEQKRVANAEKAFAQIDVPIKWLSVEPMREPLVFEDLSMFDWVVIGGQSASSGDIERHPDFLWVIDLIHQAMHSRCKVYTKPNLFAKGSPHQIVIKEYPYDVLSR